MREALTRSVRAITSAGSAIESLEPRRLFAITVEGATVEIVGGNSDDLVRIRLDPDDIGKVAVRLNGTTRRFDVEDVNRFRIVAGGGEDEIDISNKFGAIRARCVVDAGTGDDEITSSARGRETLIGGDGNDEIRGGAGHSLIQDDSGNDTLFGNGGNDRIFGGRGKDLLRGHDGNDYLYGGPGFDKLFGHAGNDILAGDQEDILGFSDEPAPPTVVGNDELDGGGGNDTLLAHFGEDTLKGGSGTDVFDAREDDDELDDRQGGEIVPEDAVFNGAAVSDDTITLTIIVDGREIRIPAAAGKLPDGTSIARAVDANGTIRFRDVDPRTFRLSEFFEAWGVTFDRRHIGRFVEEGSRELTMTVNGVNNVDFEDYEITNGDQIVIELG
jgi:Ca2+-binding RTX toxin-like protein